MNKISAPRPEHNTVGALSRKTAIAIEFWLVTTIIAVRQLAHGFGVQRFDEAGLNALFVESAFVSRANNQAWGKNPRRKCRPSAGIIRSKTIAVHRVDVEIR